MDWKWIIPKVVFVIPVLFVAVWIVYEKICEAMHSQKRKHINYSAVTFALIAIWLSSEATDIVLNRLGNVDEQRAGKIGVEIEDASARIIEAFNSHHGHVVVNKGEKAIFSALRQDILNSAFRIDIISSPSLGNQHHFEERAQLMFQALLERARNKSRSIITRRLLWRPEHLRFVDEGKYDELVGAQIAYLSPDAVNVPIAPCLIIDDSVVHFGLGHLGDPSTEDIDIVVTDVETAKAYRDYFNVLWAQSTVIKDKDDALNKEILKNIRTKLSEKSRLRKQNASAEPSAPVPLISRRTVQ